MHKKIFRYLFVFAFTGFILVSCKVTQPYKSPAMSVDSLFREATDDTATIASIHWNDFFTDTILQKLIEQGIQHNPDLQIAFTHIQQSQAYYLQSGAAFLPALNANAGVTSSKYSKSQGAQVNGATQYQTGLSASWEADIWGKLRSSKKASLATLLQTQSAARAVQTNLVASIANYYYSLLALDQQLAITQMTVRNWDTTVQMMNALKEGDVVTGAAVVQSKAQLYAAQVTIPDLKQSIKETENALSILIGNSPSGIKRGQLQDQSFMEMLHTGVPAQLLSNRPDVQQAEYNFRYYFELTNVARTYFYPSLSITGSAGLNALSFSDLFRPGSLAASIGAGLTQPIFNQRGNKTRLEVAKSQQEEAYFNFQSTLLKAGQEVSNAMSLYETSNEKTSIRTNELTALELSVDYTQELLKNGFANYTELITARQSLLQAELGRVNDRLQQLQAVVDLYRSLGGGWK